jgi:hypothetical protein
MRDHHRAKEISILHTKQLVPYDEACKYSKTQSEIEYMHKCGRCSMQTQKKGWYLLDGIRGDVHEGIT